MVAFFSRQPIITNKEHSWWYLCYQVYSDIFRRVSVSFAFVSVPFPINRPPRKRWSGQLVPLKCSLLKKQQIRYCPSRFKISKSSKFYMNEFPAVRELTQFLERGFPRKPEFNWTLVYKHLNWKQSTELEGATAPVFPKVLTSKNTWIFPRIDFTNRYLCLMKSLFKVMQRFLRHTCTVVRLTVTKV